MNLGIETEIGFVLFFTMALDATLLKQSAYFGVKVHRESGGREKEEESGFHHNLFKIEQLIGIE